MDGETRKRGLGRGLDALFGDVKREEESFEPKIRRAGEFETKNAVPAGTGSPRKIAVEKLTPGKFQPRRRFDDEAIAQLADSIAQHGVLQPLLVRPLSASMFEIIAGERRWRAAQKAQVHEVPVVVQELTDKDALEIALIENLQREDLTALEEAEGYARLMEEFGHTQDQLSVQLGKSRSHVANMLRLLKLPQGVKAKLQNGTLSAGHARALIGAKDADAIAQTIVARGLSVRQTEKLVAKASEGRLKPSKKAVKFVQKDIDILALEEKLASALGLRVTIDHAEKGKGRLTIDYTSLDQLDDVVAKLTTAGKPRGF